MEKREPISKKIRFDIFKRDQFQCQYCGKTPPAVILEVDHMKPVSKGGGNEIENLITACFDCNRGKGAGDLTISFVGTIEKAEMLAEKELQYVEYQKILRKIERRISKECDKIEEIYNQSYPEWYLKDSFKQGSVAMFIKRLGFDQVRDAMVISCNRVRNNDSKVLNYFCAVCWNKIRGDF